MATVWRRFRRNWENCCQFYCRRYHWHQHCSPSKYLRAVLYYGNEKRRTAGRAKASQTAARAGPIIAWTKLRGATPHPVESSSTGRRSEWIRWGRGGSAFVGLLLPASRTWKSAQPRRAAELFHETPRPRPWGTPRGRLFRRRGQGKTSKRKGPRAFLRIRSTAAGDQRQTTANGERRPTVNDGPSGFDGGAGAVLVVSV